MVGFFYVHTGVKDPGSGRLYIQIKHFLTESPEWEIEKDLNQDWTYIQIKHFQLKQEKWENNYRPLVYLKLK